jgi:osmotically-inducible protein OsmY
VIGRLRNDVRIGDGLIEVSVNGANVSLSGSVGSEAERQRAFSNAWVNGAQSVDIANLDVKWWLRDAMTRTHERATLDDTDIKDAIKMAYVHDPRVLSFNPQVDVEHGVVTLTGRVSNLAAKKAAAETAHNTLGVWRVHNYLLVRPEQQVSDRQLERDIMKAIARNPYTSKLDVGVVALNGSVTIRGEVDTQFEKEQMLGVVTSLRGVLDLHEFIDVGHSWAFKTDVGIKENIKGEFWWSPFVDEEEIEVSVEDGIATLTGEVDNWSEWAAAMDNAYEGGARQVRNQLKVADWPIPYTLH